jgi:LDH2 family malate/lactate/ureidoglycolate dehydrogenase
MTEPSEILKALVAGNAALAPLGGLGEITGGYKGYGYATVVEIMSAAFQNGAFMKDLLGYDEEGNKIPYPLGHFFIAIDVDAFVGLEPFKKTAGTILRNLRASDKAPGQERIYTAGEQEWEAWQYRKEKGARVDTALQQQLIEVRDEFGLDYRFDFEK